MCPIKNNCQLHLQANFSFSIFLFCIFSTGYEKDLERIKNVLGERILLIISCSFHSRHWESFRRRFYYLLRDLETGEDREEIINKLLFISFTPTGPRCRCSLHEMKGCRSVCDSIFFPRTELLGIERRPQSTPVGATSVGGRPHMAASAAPS